MSYYDTIAEDLKRAREILARGKADLHDTAHLPPAYQELAGGTIYGGDTYAAYKLLESFVAEIERLTDQLRQTLVGKVELRAEIERLRADAERERTARAVVDEALRREHALVEAVGRKVCETALRLERRVKE